MNDSWSNTEVEIIIADYFQMLSLELAGIPYSKADHRRKLKPLLNNRSEGSIEFKHQNISAILIKLGKPYITGYLPRKNYQRYLEDKVIDHLVRDYKIEKQFIHFAEGEIVTPVRNINFDKLIVPAPYSTLLEEPDPVYQTTAIKVNYLEREQFNHSLGQAGEETILSF